MTWELKRGRSLLLGIWILANRVVQRIRADDLLK